MIKIVLIIALFTAVATAQEYHRNPKTAAIISEQRYLSGDGKFGAAYSQEDGINFKEETDSDGTRHGSYSYIDPSGQRRTISYTAGKNGFQPSGDHLPLPAPAPLSAAPSARYQPQSQYQSSSANNDYDDGSYDPRYNSPSFDQQRYRAPQSSYNPVPPPQQFPYNNNYQATPQQIRPAAEQYQLTPQHQQTTQNPQRFQPPGKLSLNRTPDGFSYSFNKV